MKKFLAVFAVLATASCAFFTTTPDVGRESREVAATSGAILDKSGYKFDPADKSCGGFPRLKVQTMPGTCLGMVFGNFNSQGSDGKTMFKMPRNITKVPGTEDFLVTDMGGWADKIGQLFWLRNESGKYKLVRVANKLDYPHGLTFNDHDGFFYLGERNAIFRFHFNPKDGSISDKKFVISNLPDTAKHMHPLTQFVFDPKTGDLYMNSGAPTDHCYQEGGDYKDRCPEEISVKMASIQRIARERLDNLPANGLGFKDVQVVARGLRNSMAMAISSYGRFLVQGENSRDFPELEEPYEEMNIIRLDQDHSKPENVKHYGWPYCYNNHGESPEWEDLLIDDGDKKYTLPPPNDLKSEHGDNPFYCGRHAIQGRKEYQRPLTLIPAHAAPLSAMYYGEGMFKKLFLEQFSHMTNQKPTDTLVMSWHGYRVNGQRLVVYPTNAQGLPIPSKQGKRYYNFNLPNGCPKPAPFNPRGGLRDHFVDYKEVISGWGPIEGQRPRGAPTGITSGNDGSIWIVEDKNKAIVRLTATDDPAVNYQQDGCDSAPGQNKDYNVPLLVWRNALMDDTTLKLRADFNTIANGLKQDKFACAKCHDKLVNADLNSDFKTNPDEFATLDYFVRMDWVVGGKLDQSKMYTSVTHSGTTVPMPAEPDGEDLNKSVEGKNIIKTLERWIGHLPSPAEINKRSEQTTVKQDSLNIRRTPGTEFGPCGQFKKDDIVYIDPRPETKKVVGNFKWSKVYMVPGHSRLVPNACPYPLDGVFWLAREPK